MSGIWWDSARIDATVTRQFVEQHLLPEERERLDMDLAFGQGLTNGTYWEWINWRSKRLFLILVDLDITDQIFGIIDDSWNDDDLPIPLENIRRLALTPVKDDKIERKFFHRQYHYLLRHLQKGEHALYSDQDVVPIDVVERPPGLTTRGQLVDRVRIPGHPGKVLCRRRYPLGTGPGCTTQAEFLDAVNAIKPLQSDHIVSYWGSYVHQGSAYVLFTPSSDFNLKSFLTTTPPCFKNLSKKGRRELVLNWILCLVDTLCSVHSRNSSHNCIKPSTILFNLQNHIFYADSTRLSPESWLAQADRQGFDTEWYNYAAPEQWYRPSSGPTSPGSKLMPFSTSPESTFVIPGSSSQNPANPSSMLHAPTPHLNPQQADIFSLGCIILELLTFLVKRNTRSFATYRSQRRKMPGRGGAVMDISFHKNLGQVEGWMGEIAKDATKMQSDSEGGNVLRGVTPMLHVVTRMLSANPHDRPTAFEVQQRTYQILTDSCGISEPHCVHQYGGLEYSLNRWRITDPDETASTITALPIKASTMPVPKMSRGRSESGAMSPRAMTHSRTGSSGGLSSGGSSTGSGSGGGERGEPRERNFSIGLGSWRVPGRKQVRSPDRPAWQESSNVYASQGSQAPVC